MSRNVGDVVWHPKKQLRGTLCCAYLSHNFQYDALSSRLEQPENKEEVIQGDIDLQSLHLGKTVHRRCAELVKTADGKNDGNTANKKGNTKNRKSAVEQSAMVRKNNVTNNKSVQSWYLFICLLLWTRKLQMLIVSVVFPWTLWTNSYGEGEWKGGEGNFRAAWIYFLLTFPLYEFFFMPVHEYFLWLLGVHEFLSFVLRPPTPLIIFLMVCPLFLSCFKPGVVLVKYWRKWKGLKNLNAVLERAQVHMASGWPC